MGYCQCNRFPWAIGGCRTVRCFWPCSYPLYALYNTFMVHGLAVRLHVSGWPLFFFQTDVVTLQMAFEHVDHRGFVGFTTRIYYVACVLTMLPLYVLVQFSSLSAVTAALATVLQYHLQRLSYHSLTHTAWVHVVRGVGACASVWDLPACCWRHRWPHYVSCELHLAT